MMTGNLFNYLFQVTMGRMLSVKTFGEMNALFSLMAIFSVPFASITNYLAKNVSHCYAVGREKQANDLIIRNYRNLFIIGCIIVISLAPFSGFISESLKIKSLTPIILFILSILISLILPINTGILQGIQSFRTLSIFFAGTSIFKYLICVALVAIGMGLNGIMIGIILSTLLVAYISFIPIGRHLRKGRKTINPQDRDSLSVIIPIVLANLAFTFFTQSDIVLVKYFFTPQEAGIYSSASVLGKAVMYLPGAIVMSLFPMVASNKALNKGTTHLIIKALAITVLLSGGGTIILYLFPDLVISIFFGERFAPAAGVVGLFAIAMLPLAVIMIVMNYNIAKGEKYFTYVMLVFAAIQIAGIIVFHDSLNTVLKVIFFSGLFCMVVLFSMLIFEYYKNKIYSFASTLITNK
ncbi:MAG TPA: hypothetical protein ENH52_02025 [Nitrospirae bacterium]|nr:hypothetical protein [Nitrospirota bacterium]